MMDNKRPNILFFFSDQQRWDTCGCYGQELPVTPNIDKMAAEGVRFNSAYSCQPVCGPARSSLQTGKYPTEIGCHINHTQLPPDEMTIAKMMSAAGYEVGYVGKWHLASCGTKDGDNNYLEKPVPDNLRGGWKDFWIASDVLEFTSHSYDGHMFDINNEKRVFPEGRYRVDCVTDFAVEFLESRSGDKPWFLFVSYIEPHHQNDHECYEGPHGSKEKWRGYKVPGDLENTEGDWRENYPDYLGCCNALDSSVGRLRGELERLGFADNTLFIYTSDHGSHFRTRNREYKRSCHDGCTHIPMVACGPGFEGGTVVDNLVSLIDIPPTFLAAGGLDVPEYMRGAPLQNISGNNHGEWRDDVFMQISESQVGRAVRTRKWKYSVSAPDKKGWQPDSDTYVEEFLYDLENDPHEKNNLVGDPSLVDVRVDMAERLKTWMAKIGEKEPEICPASSKVC